MLRVRSDSTRADPLKLTSFRIGGSILSDTHVASSDDQLIDNPACRVAYAG